MPELAQPPLPLPGPKLIFAKSPQDSPDADPQPRVSQYPHPNIGHYIVTGGSPCPEARPSCASAPKSDYIIRQRRNHKKLKRIKEKR